MSIFKYQLAAILFALLSAPVAFASAASISLTSVSATTVPVATSVTFSLTPSGFAPISYQLTDSQSTSSVSAANIDSLGNFSWTPNSNDIGTHTLSIIASDSIGVSASTTQMITVTPPPSLTIQSLSATTVMPGSKLTFTANASGFTNPRFAVGDAFGGGSITDTNIDTSGNFSWTPDLSQTGTHTITVYASDALGHSASVSQTVQVGAGPSLAVQTLSPGAGIGVGQPVSFSVYATNYTPTSFAVADSFVGSSTVSAADLSATGYFSWTPASADIGTHVLRITGTVGALGQSASTTQTIIVAYSPAAAAQTAAQAAANAATTTTASASTTALSALQAQIAQLQSQIAAHSTSVSGTASGSHTFVLDLKLGSSGAEVTALQNALTAQGFFSGTASGYFGPLTAAAVKKFQAAHGVAQLGNVGPATRAALNGSTSSSNTVSSTSASSTSGGFVFRNFIGAGSHGADVTELQTRLSALGFFSGTPSGYFGSATEAAVKAFQSAHGIAAKGYVGPSTRAALNQ